MITQEDIKKVINEFRENDLCYDCGCFNGLLSITIEWGDWKHDHGFADYLMQKMGYTLLSEQITEEDGSDCYSSIHIYKKNEKN